MCTPGGFIGLVQEDFFEEVLKDWTDNPCLSGLKLVVISRSAALQHCLVQKKSNLNKIGCTEYNSCEASNTHPLRIDLECCVCSVKVTVRRALT